MRAMAKSKKLGGAALRVLREARWLYLRGAADYRDRMVHVGQLLQEALLTQLEAGVSLNERERRRQGLTRREILSFIAVELGVTPAKVNELLRIQAVVALLAEARSTGYVLGTLSMSCLRVFRVLVERVRGEVCRSKRASEPALLDVQQRSEWQLRRIAVHALGEEEVKGIFRRAVERGWTARQCRVELESLLGIKDSGASSRSPLSRKRGEDYEHKDSLDAACRQVQRSLAAACPRDAAELVLSLLAGAGCTTRVREVIRERLG